MVVNSVFDEPKQEKKTCGNLCPDTVVAIFISSDSYGVCGHLKLFFAHKHPVISNYFAQQAIQFLCGGPFLNFVQKFHWPLSIAWVWANSKTQNAIEENTCVVCSENKFVHINFCFTRYFTHHKPLHWNTFLYSLQRHR